MADLSCKTLPDGVSPAHPDYRHLLPAEIGDVPQREDGPRGSYKIMPEWGDPLALPHVVGGKSEPLISVKIVTGPTIKPNEWWRHG